MCGLAGRSLFDARGMVGAGGLPVTLAGPVYAQHPCASSTGLPTPFPSPFYPWMGPAAMSAAQGSGMWNAAMGAHGVVPWGWAPDSNSSRALQLEHRDAHAGYLAGAKVGGIKHDSNDGKHDGGLAATKENGRKRSLAQWRACYGCKRAKVSGLEGGFTLGGLA